MQVRIEPQDEHHASGLFAALQDPVVHTFLGSSPPASVAAIRDRIARQARGPQDGSGDRWLNWVVLVDDSLAGFTQVTIRPDGTANLAYVISSAYWGQSIGYQACRLTLQCLGGISGLRRVVADTERDNLRSRRLLSRLGFRLRAETATDAYYDDGGDLAHVLPGPISGHTPDDPGLG